MVFKLFWGFIVSVVLMISRMNFFFSSLTVVRIKTQSQIFVKLDMLLSETLLDYHDACVLYIYISQQTICRWLSLQLLHCLTLYHIQDHYCTFLQSWCIVKVLSTDCITHLVLSYSCCYFFPIFKNIVQITDSSSFNSGIKITGFFFLFIQVKALVITKKKPFSINHCLYCWKRLYCCW